MPRPRLYPTGGVRRTVTLPQGLDEELGILAVKRRTSISLVIQSLLVEALAAKVSGGPSAGPSAATFPEEWDGKDLRDRLVNLRMRQKDLAADLGVHYNTLNGWVRGEFPFPSGMLARIQDALTRWNPNDGKFKWGSRSPRTR